MVVVVALYLLRSGFPTGGQCLAGIFNGLVVVLDVIVPLRGPVPGECPDAVRATAGMDHDPSVREILVRQEIKETFGGADSGLPSLMVERRDQRVHILRICGHCEQKEYMYQ